MKKLAFFLSALAVFTASRAAALELSLEENKGESGTVGYVDIDRVFKEYSGTLNAREDFLVEIKRKEGTVNERKRAIYVLKADIAKLRQEREFALTLPALLATQDQLNTAKAAPVSTQPAVSPPAAAPAEISTGSAASVQSSTAPAAALSAAKAAAPSPESAAQPIKIISSAAAPPPSGPPPGAAPSVGLVNLPGISNVPMNYFKFSVSTSVPEIDSAIAVKESDLRQKEDALKSYQHQVENELLEYESHKSEILLGRIYLALKELAVKEGVSVVIDKRNILFGHSAVDLTDKLLKQMEEAP